MKRYNVKFETGPTAADCYREIVVAESGSMAEEIVATKFPRAMITSIEEVKGNTMSQFAVNAQTAREATNKARSLAGEYKRAETNKILESIQAAASKGEDSVQTGRLESVVEQRLRELNFKVQWTDGYDQRDPGYTTISW